MRCVLVSCPINKWHWYCSENRHLGCTMEVPMAMGRPKAALVLSPEGREQLESLASSRSLPAGLVNRGADHSDECFGKNEPADCPAVGTGERYGGQVAAPIPGAGCDRVARRVASGPPSSDQRRARGPVGSQNAGDETAKRHALEHPADRTPDATVEVHRAPHLAGVRIAAASPAAFQPLERSVLRREGARHRGVVSASPRTCSGFVCR